MEIKEIKARLTNKKGHSFLYQAHQVRLLDFEITGDSCLVKFDNRNLKLPVASVPALLRELLPVDGPTASTDVARVEPLLPMQATNVLSDVNSMLLDAMKKVQGNPNYINQAKAMTAVGNVIVNSAKTQVMAAALLLKARRED